MSTEKFYDSIRLFFPKAKLTAKQVEGTDALLNYWIEHIRATDPDIRKLAYVLATTFHETATTMQPINEYGKGKGKPYGKKIKHSGVPYQLPNQLYYGRGFVQLTWFENYELIGRLIGVNLLANPELALSLNVAIQIIFEGMYKGSSSIGDFTGKCLEMYFNAKIEDPKNARRIINGTDKAALIASYYTSFLNALKYIK